MKTRLRRQGGFTLIELLVTISIAAVLMLVATPSFVTFQRNSELTAAANSMLASVGAARTEAMKRNLPALIAPTGTSWAGGWRTYVDVDRSASFTAGDITVMTVPAMPSYFTVTGVGAASGSAPYLRFDGSGFSRVMSAGTSSSSTATLAFARNDLTGASLLAQTRYLVLALTGRARVCKPASASDPTCSATSTN